MNDKIIETEINDEKIGVKETKEVLIALTALTINTIKEYKKSKQIIPALVAAFTVPGMTQKLETAIVGITGVVEEIKDIDFGEVLELASAEIEELKN